MQATALICDEQQNFSLQTVELGEIAADQIAVRTHYSGVSIGTEFALIRGKISWGPYPLCTGYQGTGTVIAVGDDITDFEPGDEVYFRGNDRMTLADGTPVSPVQGAHCSHIIIKPHTSHGADHVPPGVPLDQAALFVMPAVGLNGVDMANPRMGQTVVVHGVGQIGLGVVAACAHRGCRIIAVDLDDRRLQVARDLGADYTINGTEADVHAEIYKLAPEGADVVFECTGLPECIDPAIELCRPLGTMVWQGNYGEAPISLHFLPAHARRLHMVFPCDDGMQPCRRAVLRNMALGALRWDKVITHRVEAADAPELFDRINKGKAPDVIGAVIRW